MKYDDFFAFESLPQFSNDEIPLVSIYCLTYNHEPFIEDALRGFVEQRTTFRYEVILFDDASTDGTSDVVRQYANKYPDIIKAFIAKENTYHNQHRKEAMKDFFNRNFRGKYLAFCEGDDCWVDRHKLQIQIEYMESHSNCTMTVHGGIWVDYAKNKLQVFDQIDSERDLTLGDVMWHRCPMYTASMVFRYSKTRFEKYFCNTGVSDWSLQLYSIAEGELHYFDRIMSIYRFRTPGSWNERRLTNDEMNVVHIFRAISMLDSFNHSTEKRYERDVINKVNDYVVWLCDIYSRNKDDFEKAITELVGKYPETTWAIDEFFRYFDFYLISKKKKPRALDNDTFYRFNKKIIIWGTGVGGTGMAEYLKAAAVEFEGFCETDPHTEFYYGKRVYKISDINELDDCMVVVGIFSIPWEILQEQLDRDIIKNYYFPFVFHVSD